MNPCSLLKDNCTKPENVLSSTRLGGGDVLFLEDEKIIFQSHFLKWVCLCWWITSELLFEDLRASENSCEKADFLGWWWWWWFLERFSSHVFRSTAEQVLGLIWFRQSLVLWLPHSHPPRATCPVPDVGHSSLPPTSPPRGRKTSFKELVDRWLLSSVSSLTLPDVVGHLLLIIPSRSTWDVQQRGGFPGEPPLSLFPFTCAFHLGCPVAAFTFANAGGGQWAVPSESGEKVLSWEAFKKAILLACFREKLGQNI